MKIRSGFVANSSSSSFIVDKSRITAVQYKAIANHVRYVQEHFPDWYWTNDDAWHIDETDVEIHGYTPMDNLDMEMLFVELGISNDAYTFYGG